jgi:short-subunit dehydrogenase
LCNQLAEQSPSLVEGYDNQGNAILNIGSTASEAESALLRMYEAAKLAANVGIGEEA